MTYTSDLIDGLAALLADNGIGVYDPAGVYQASDTGITVGIMPDSPDRCLCLTAYPVEDTGLTDVTTGVQIRVRAGRDPRDAGSLDDSVFDLLHNARGYQLGGVPVAVSWRQSSAPLGQDDKGRTEISSNYYLRATRSYPNAYE